MLLKALGWDDAKILEEFGDYESIRATLEKDHTTGQDDALLDIYRKLRPGEPPTREAAQTLLDNLYFNPKRYDLAKVGRYKVNKKLGLDLPVGSSVLTIDDIVETIRFLVKLHAGETEMPAMSPRTAARCGSRSTTSTTSATVACARSASSSRTRCAPACPGWSASSASG